MAVTDALAAAILDETARLELRVSVRWLDRGASVRAEMAVHNTHGLPVYVGMQIMKDKPWKPTAYLMTQGVQLRRLDVNATHTNRTTDRERWKQRTHKHLWSEAHQDARAYTPDDVPEVPFEHVTAEDYRAVFEAFLEECGVARGGAYAWSDPDLGLGVSR